MGESEYAHEAARLLTLVLETQNAVESGDPLRALHAITLRQGWLTIVTAECVAMARCQGLTWQKIGDAMGISKQAAWQRFEARGAGATFRDD